MSHSGMPRGRRSNSIDGRAFLRRFIAVSVWLHLGAVILCWLILRFGTDATWWGTVVAFAPRWVWGLPGLILVPVAVAARRWRLLAVQGLTAVVFAGLVMGFRLSGGLDCPTLNGLNVRVMTCNVQGGDIDAAAFATLIGEVGPDIVALQECPPGLAAELFPEDWFVEQRGKLCVVSRFPIEGAEAFDRRPFGGWGAAALICRIDTPEGPTAFVNVHLATVRPGLESVMKGWFAGAPDVEGVIDGRRRESEAISRWIAAVPGPVILAGDFNMPVESRIYRDYWSRYQNAFSSTGLGLGHTKLTRWHGIRIDHVLTDAYWQPICCRVLEGIGSDHRPMIAEVRRIARDAGSLP